MVRVGKTMIGGQSENVMEPGNSLAQDEIVLKETNVVGHGVQGISLQDSTRLRWDRQYDADSMTAPFRMNRWKVIAQKGVIAYSTPGGHAAGTVGGWKLLTAHDEQEGGWLLVSELDEDEIM